MYALVAIMYRGLGKAMTNAVNAVVQDCLALVVTVLCGVENSGILARFVKAIMLALDVIVRIVPCYHLILFQISPSRILPTTCAVIVREITLAWDVMALHSVALLKTFVVDVVVPRQTSPTAMLRLRRQAWLLWVSLLVSPYLQ